MAQDYYSNDPTKNLDNFLSEEGLEISSKDRNEIVDIVSGSDAEALLLDGKNMVKGTTHDLKSIMGDALRTGLLWLPPLIMAVFLTLQYLQTQKDNIVVSTTLYDYYEKSAEREAVDEVIKTTAEPPLPENQHNQSTSIGSVLPAADSNKTDTLETSPGDISVKGPLEGEYVNQYHPFKKDCIMLLEKADIDSVESLSYEPWYLANTHTVEPVLIDPKNELDFSESYNNWQYVSSLNKNLNTLNNNQELINEKCRKLRSIHLETLIESNGINIVNNKNGIIANNKTQRTIILTITDLSIHHKSNVSIKKGSIVYLASHGAIANSSGLVFKPEGLETSASLPENATFERLLNQYPVGALLFRLGEKDEWKAYSSALSKFIAQTDGLLEFTINLKTPDTNKLSGNFYVEVMTSTFK